MLVLNIMTANWENFCKTKCEIDILFDCDDGNQRLIDDNERIETHIGNKEK